MKTVFKKIMASYILLALVLGVLSAGKPAEAAAVGYLFKYKGASVSADSAAKTLIQKAGKPQKKQTKKSCAYKGKDRIYQYKDFWLSTYSKTDDGPEYVQQIQFRSKKVKTDKGIKIGSKESQIIKKYGKKYDPIALIPDKKDGSYKYVYQKGNCTLQIKVKNKKVTGITYLQTKVI